MTSHCNAIKSNDAEGNPVKLDVKVTDGRGMAASGENPSPQRMHHSLHRGEG